MGTLTLYGPKLINGAAAHHPKTQAAVLAVAEAIEARATASLEQSRANDIVRIDGKDGMHKITRERGTNEYGDVDWVVALEGPGAMAIEFGHAPSGHFDPDRYGKVTKAPQGLYILSGAAGFGQKTLIPGGRKGKTYKGRNRGKR
jgi:hypothetical protein